MIDLFGEPRIGDLPSHAKDNWPDREALVYKGSRWNFEQMSGEVDRLAWTLMWAGVQPGDKVGMWFTNCPEYIFLFFAIAKIGAVVVPLNTRYRTQDLGYCLRQSECAVLLYVEQSGPVNFGEMVEGAVGNVKLDSSGNIVSDRLPNLRRLIAVGNAKHRAARELSSLAGAAGAIDYSELEKRSAAIAASDLAMIVYTSGTTGEAKGVMLTHLGVRQAIVRSLIWGTTQMDRQLHYLPMFHLYAIGFVTIPSVALGSCQILMDTFDGTVAVELIHQERATIIHGFDPHYRDIIAAQEKLNLDLSSLRMGSFPSGPDNCIPVVKIANEKLCPVYPSFGLTETWSGTTAGFLDCSIEQRSVSSGHPLPNIDIRVVDPETGQDQPIGIQGELLIRSPAVTIGYYRMPEETAEAIDADGYLHTGDAGYRRPDGYIRFTGRYKDILKVGGENVSPAEVELLLSEIKGIADVTVVGYPDVRLQEVAAAFVILSDKNAPVTIDDVTAHCRGKIASFKIPRHVFVVDEFPMTPSGKIQKGKLRDVAADHYRANSDRLSA